MVREHSSNSSVPRVFCCHITLDSSLNGFIGIYVAPSNEYSFSFSSICKSLDDSDVGLVCLTSKNKTPVVPGKILGYMAAGVPIAAFLNKESDAHSIISDSGCGYAAVSDDEESAYQIIWRICREKSRLKSLGENGYKYVRAHFGKDICLKAFEKLFDSQ